MRHSMRFPSFRSHRSIKAEGACRQSAECQRLRQNDAARDHLSRRGSDQATTVARRTNATWR